MNSSTSMTMGRLTTGPVRAVDSREFPRLVTETSMGLAHRGRPPPDAAARVASTCALLGALWLALAIQCAVGG